MTQQKIRTCQQCKKEFTIENEDFAFYEKIDVLEPTFCFYCRLQRKLAWRNERVLYSRQCDLCHKSILALYPKQSPYIVYCHQCYWSDTWSGKAYAKEIDWSKPFFDQFAELLRTVPHPAIYVDKDDNSEYTNFCYGIKNCYLTFGSDLSEDCYYSSHILECKNCVDCINSDHLELCCGVVDCHQCFNTHYSQECSNMQDSYFCFDCKSCSYCFGCVGLRNKKYFIFNHPYSADEYAIKVKELLQKYSKQELEEKARQIKYTQPIKGTCITQSENSTGDHLQNCSNAYYCFDSSELQNCRYMTKIIPKAFDCMDVYGGRIDLEQCYELLTGIGHNLRFSMLCWKSVFDINYSILTNNAHDCFGCFSFYGGQYAILNKEYSEEEYKKLYTQLIEYMKKTGEWGEFFPANISPFAYNETRAQIDFPLTKEGVEARQWKWREDIQKTTGKETANITRLPHLAQQVAEDIENAIFTCQTCKRNFKILSQEFSFYQKQNVFLPKECYECRFQYLSQKRNPYQLWERQCQCKNGNHGHTKQCQQKLETTYAPERPEIVYCEE